MAIATMRQASNDILPIKKKIQKSGKAYGSRHPMTDNIAYKKKISKVSALVYVQCEVTI
jgi:hypothetical protein